MKLKQTVNQRDVVLEKQVCSFQALELKRWTLRSLSPIAIKKINSNHSRNQNQLQPQIRIYVGTQ
jgi:hypothetical protein